VRDRLAFAVPADSPKILSRNLIAYLASRFCAATAMKLLRAGIAWHVFALTKSAFYLGLVGLIQFVPAFSLVLVGGAVADTYERRRVMALAQSVALTASVVLFLVTWRGGETIPLLYGLVAVVAAAGAFDSPARASILPTLVPRAIFPRAVTIAATNQALAFASGPALAGLLIAGAGPASIYVAYACLLVGSIVGLAFLRVRPNEAVAPRGLSLRAVREGLVFVRHRKVVLGCMSLDMLAVIFGGAAALLPIYANDILQVGPRGYGLLTSSLELGALATSFVLTMVPPIRRAGRTLLVAVAVYSVATIVFGLSRTFPLSVAAYMLVGVADQVSVVLRSTTIQLSTPDELRGRVSAINMMFIGASNQLGAAESGFVAALTSAPFAVVSGGVVSLAIAVVIARLLPELRHYRIDRDPMDT
jgi:MFS family permease